MIVNPGDIAHGYRLEQWTQTWQRVDGRWYRDAIATRLIDGARRRVLFLDPSL